MNKTKKKGFLKIAGIMAVMMMLATCVVSGTMAKYTSTGTTTGGSVGVAKWSIKVGEDETELSNTVSLASLSWNIFVDETENEVDDATVIANKIAPGTWGYAAIKVTNASDVAALLKVSGNPTPTDDVVKSTNLQFKVVANEDTATKTSYGALTNKEDIVDLATTGVTLPKTNGSITIYICYQWKYASGQDDKDTEMGKAEELTLTLGTLTITAEQVVPTAKS